MTNTELLTALRLIDRRQLISDVQYWKMRQDKECGDYQVDLYLYLNPDGSYLLDTYINVGGNSWLDDDHITICSHISEFDIWDDIEDIAELADIIDEPLEHVIEEVAAWADCDPEDVSLIDAIAWCKGCENDDWCDRVYEAWCDRVNDCSPEYYYWADETVNEKLDSLEWNIDGGGAE